MICRRLFFFFFILVQCALLFAKPKNIILFIADGAGMPAFSHGLFQSPGSELEKFTCIGLVKTGSLSGITDSAAAVTALACGVRTKNGFLGMTAEGRKAESVLEQARKKRKSTGLVATCGLTHATPAGYYAHVNSRSDETEIARQCGTAGIDVLLGGGYGFFKKSGALDAMTKKGYILVRTAEELKGVKTDKAARLLGLFGDEDMGACSGRTPSLREMTQTAIRILSRNTNGFFLMVEGSQIDWAGHANNAEGLECEMLEFLDALKPAGDFLQKERSTLILVTADHETGGIFISDQNPVSGASEISFASTAHTGEMVPLFARGESAELFGGIYDNTLVALLIKDLLK